MNSDESREIPELEPGLFEAKEFCTDFLRRLVAQDSPACSSRSLDAHEWLKRRHQRCS